METNNSSNHTTSESAVRVNWYYSARFWVAFGVAGILLNICEGVFIYFNKKHRTAFGLTLASLCLADILGGISFTLAGAWRLAEYNGPLTVQLVPNTSFIASWKAGHGALFFSVGTSFVHIMIIAIQRLFAVISPIVFKAFFTRRRCAILLIITWTALFISGVIGYFYVQNLWTASYLLMLAVGSILIICYIVICCKSWLYSKKRQLMTAGSTKSKSTVEKTVLVSVAVTLAFLVCTFPQSIFYLFVRDVEDLTFYHIVNCIISMNPCLDSLVYFCFYHEWGTDTDNKQNQTHTTPVMKHRPVKTKEESIPLTSKLTSKEPVPIPSVVI